MPRPVQGLRGGLDAEETSAAPAGSVPTMEVIQSSGASGEIIHQMDASLLEVSPDQESTAVLAYVACRAVCLSISVR